MLEKWYCIRCDNCGEVIGYWQTHSSISALELEKRNNVEEFIATPSHQFCSKKCQKEWLKRRRQAKKDQKEMDKIMEKFV